MSHHGLSRSDIDKSRGRTGTPFLSRDAVVRSKHYKVVALSYEASHTTLLTRRKKLIASPNRRVGMVSQEPAQSTALIRLVHYGLYLCKKVISHTRTLPVVRAPTGTVFGCLNSGHVVRLLDRLCGAAAVRLPRISASNHREGRKSEVKRGVGTRLSYDPR